MKDQKEIKRQAKNLEKALDKHAKRLQKMPLRFADPKIVGEDSGQDKQLLDSVEARLAELADLRRSVTKSLNDMEVLLLQLKHIKAARRDAKKAAPKVAKAKKPKKQKKLDKASKNGKHSGAGVTKESAVPAAAAV